MTADLDLSQAPSDFEAICPIPMTAFRHQTARAWAELWSGAAVPLVHVRSDPPAVAGWLSRTCPAGAEVTEVAGVRELVDGLAGFLRRVRDGGVVKIVARASSAYADDTELAYLSSVVPPGYAATGLPIPVTVVRGRGGALRRVEREVVPV